MFLPTPRERFLGGSLTQVNAKHCLQQNIMYRRKESDSRACDCLGLREGPFSPTPWNVG